MPKFRTVRFGELEYRQEDVLCLPEGLVGMPTLRNWLILDMGEDLAMRWLQSLDRGDFGFPVTQPEFFLDEYEVKIPSSIKEIMDSQKEDDAAILIITTVHPGGQKVTGNLVAPLVVDTKTRRGYQMTLDGDELSLRQEINYFKFGLAVQSQASENAPSIGKGQQSPDADAKPDQVNQESGAETPEPVSV